MKVELIEYGWKSVTTEKKKSVLVTTQQISEKDTESILPEMLYVATRLLSKKSEQRIPNTNVLMKRRSIESPAYCIIDCTDLQKTASWTLYFSLGDSLSDINQLVKDSGLLLLNFEPKTQYFILIVPNKKSSYQDDYIDIQAFALYLWEALYYEKKIDF